MAPAACLILYGNSVFLAGIKAQLECCPAGDCDGCLELVSLDSDCPEAVQRVREYRSARIRAVLFDTSQKLPGFLLELLRKRPGLLLVGVDPSCDRLLLLSARSQQALSIADLMAVIKQSDWAAKGKALYGEGGCGHQNEEREDCTRS